MPEPKRAFGCGGRKQDERAGVIMSSSRERKAWTEFVEAREARRTARKPRAKKHQGPTPEELNRRSTILSARPSG
jgi:hypothetical protein